MRREGATAAGSKPQGYAPVSQQSVEGRNISTPSVRQPPLPSIFIIKFEFLHDLHIVPIYSTDNSEWEQLPGSHHSPANTINDRPFSETSRCTFSNSAGKNSSSLSTIRSAPKVEVTESYTKL